MMKTQTTATKMKRITAILWALAMAGAALAAEPQPQPGNGTPGAAVCLRLAPVRVNPLWVHPEERRLRLDGKWQFRLDPTDQGMKERWFDAHAAWTDEITVPGCWQGQGFGSTTQKEPHNELKQLRVNAFRATYTGTGWYERRFSTPAEWKTQRVWLNFGGVYPTAEVWLNGVKLGENHLPFVPFGFDATSLLRFDGENRLTVRVSDQDLYMGFYYYWNGRWSGLYRSVELTATARHFLREFCVYPDLAGQKVRFKVRIGDSETLAPGLRLKMSVRQSDNSGTPATVEVPVTSGTVESEVAVAQPQPWSPEHPQLYRVDAVLLEGAAVCDALSERTGFMTLSTSGKHFLINGEPYFMRGHGDCFVCPETGSPDTDRARWVKKLKALREYGYNYVRCHSYVYNPEYFDAADEVGIMVQSEMGAVDCHWGARPYKPATAAAIDEQWNAVVLRDVNHPSAAMYSMSNELSPPADKRPPYADRAWQCYRATKAIKPNAFVIWTSGNWHKDMPGDFVDGGGRGDHKFTQPTIQHEWRWWSSFPDVRNMHKYTGAVRPFGAEVAREAATKRGQAHLLEQYAINSQRLQLLEAKLGMEGVRRDFEHLAGISQNSASDFNPTPQGILDEFYERKLVDAATWQQTNGDTVILAKFSAGDSWHVLDCNLKAGETRACRFVVSDFAHPPMNSPTISWRLISDGETLASGKVSYAHKPYCACPAGEIQLTVPALTRARAARLEATLTEGERVVSNSWNLWLFPDPSPFPAKLRRVGPLEKTWIKDWSEIPTASIVELRRDRSTAVLAERLDVRLIDFMRAGGRVILAATRGLVHVNRDGGFGSNGYFRTPPANYPSYEDGQNGTIIQNHPALGDFPHEGFADLQFLRLMEDTPRLDLERLGLIQGEPILRVIQRFPVCRPLASMVERSVGKGGLILCALNLSPGRTEARHLLGQLCAYAAGEKFHPKVELADASLKRLLYYSDVPNLGAAYGAKVIHASSREFTSYDRNGTGPIDGDPGSRWQSAEGAKFPQEIQIELKERVELTGFSYWPAEPDWYFDSEKARIAGYEFYVSDDPAKWGAPVAQGTFPDSAERQQVKFAAPHAGRYVRLVATGSHDHGKKASVAVGELGLITEPTTVSVKGKDLAK